MNLRYGPYPGQEPRLLYLIRWSSFWGPPQHLLVFGSAEKTVGLTAPCKPHEAQLGNWRVFETLLPHPHEDLRNKGLGVYKMALERVVATQKEVWSGLTEAQQLAHELDVAWCYAWEKPYFATQMQWISLDAPEGWTGNLREVERNIQREAGGLVFEAVAMVQRNWTWWPILPLQRTLVAREACIRASSPVSDLMELHIGSHKATEGRLFMLAKALEIIGAFFGATAGRAIRNQSIETEMRRMGLDAVLTQTVEWLFDVANERFDVRHAWDRGSPGIGLHPRMTEQERMDFTFNADLIIRAFICERLGLAVPIITRNKGEPTTTGKWSGEQLQFGAQPK